MCSCDGVEPSEAMQQLRGGYQRQVNMIAQRKREQEKGQRNTWSSSKRKKVQSHFHKVGILESERKNKKTKKRVPSKKKAQSDKESSFHPSYDNSHNSDSSSTILDNKTTMVNESRAIEVEGEAVAHNSPSIPTEFQMQIKNSEDDDLFGDSVEADIVSKQFDPLATIAKIIKRKRKEDSK